LGGREGLHFAANAGVRDLPPSHYYPSDNTVAGRVKVFAFLMQYALGQPCRYWAWDS
jgi:hypothetical protein